MTLKNIKLYIVIRILLLAISLFFVAFLLFQQNAIVQGIYASLIPIALTIELIAYIDRNNRHIRNYLEAIKWDDLSIKMPENIHNKSFQDLNKSLNTFNSKLEILRKENFTQYYFIEALIKEALVGLMVIDKNNNVFFANKSFEQIIGCSKIHLFKAAKSEISGIWDNISNLKINEKRAIEFNIKGQSKIVLFQVSEFIIETEKYRLFSAQNIKSEVENTELEAWKKLIRILSHEILNSASPILSLSNTLSDLITDNECSKDLLIDKLTKGLDVIIQRSSGLIKFTNAFSTISKLPKPEKAWIQTEGLLQKVQMLYQSIFNENKIEFQFKVLLNAEELFADQYQIEQVLINLIKNSIESFNNLQDNKKISIDAISQSGLIQIKVEDNGCGIQPDKLDKIFLPFFTTKENGNGIGLALSKQIMNLHKGSMTLISTPEIGTKVILEFDS